jgi:glycosyltransferase involved in cell wall biosynthesis
MLMMPPYPALVLCRAVARVRGVPLVVDAHSAVFEDTRWQRFLSPTIRSLRHCDLTIVTNARHRNLLELHGVVAVELHNPPNHIDRSGEFDPEGHVLVPASWHVDEPIGEIIGAARMRPHRQFIITGHPSPAVQRALGPIPHNVHLTGFVPRDQYLRLLAQAAVVCCLTLNDNTMQMGGYEAMSIGAPLVTSDFSLLREYFGDAAEYASPTAAGIGAALDQVFVDCDGYARRMNRRRDLTHDTYDESVAPVRDVLERGGSE